MIVVEDTLKELIKQISNELTLKNHQVQKRHTDAARGEYCPFYCTV